jgi:hypothetical protein
MLFLLLFVAVTQLQLPRQIVSGLSVCLSVCVCVCLLLCRWTLVDTSIHCLSFFWHLSLSKHVSVVVGGDCSICLDVRNQSIDVVIRFDVYVFLFMLVVIGEILKVYHTLLLVH